jgi:hypothetical protein
VECAIVDDREVHLGRVHHPLPIERVEREREAQRARVGEQRSAAHEVELNWRQLRHEAHAQGRIGRAHRKVAADLGRASSQHLDPHVRSEQPRPHALNLERDVLRGGHHDHVLLDEAQAHALLLLLRLLLLLLRLLLRRLLRQRLWLWLGLWLGLGLHLRSLRRLLRLRLLGSLGRRRLGGRGLGRRRLGRERLGLSRKGDGGGVGGGGGGGGRHGGWLDGGSSWLCSGRGLRDGELVGRGAFYSPRARLCSARELGGGTAGCSGQELHVSSIHSGGLSRV